MLTQLLFPFSNAVLTRIAAELGEATVAAFGFGTRIESIAMIGSMALSSEIIPLLVKIMVLTISTELKQQAGLSFALH